MSILFGVRAADGEPVAEDQLRMLARATSRYATDGTSFATRANVGMGFQPYHTHERSRLEVEPVKAVQGNMVSFDGRLDNHDDLCRDLEIQTRVTPDSEIVLAAFDRWGEDCFSRFVGDWALALWSDVDRVLYLARDHAGTRTLYYEIAQGRVRWSTYVDTFLVESTQCAIDDAYAACYLAGQPAGDLTPFEGIRAVPPAHLIRIDGRKISRKNHWNPWKSTDEICYRSDDEYGEHFLSLFKESVRRRSNSAEPVVAQLSGGMDSSSIVCVSDLLRRDSGAGPEYLIDTISFFDDSEPGWDERPYFSAVERARGKEGMHFEASFRDRTFEPLPASAGFYAWPDADSGSLRQEDALSRLLASKGTRVVLSGLGGDELLGGVPTGTPELADLLVRGRFGTLCTLAFRWCLPTRRPLLEELIGAGKATWTAYFGLGRNSVPAPDWISGQLREILQARKPARPGIAERSQLLPSQIFACEAWHSILDSLPHLRPGHLCRYEFRYPYLDRDLVDFLFAIPRSQLIRPGRRRFLMRNAMKGIVPDAVLERPRKALVERSPMVALRRNQQRLRALFQAPQISQMSFVDVSQVTAALERVFVSNTATEWPLLLRLINLEIWLRGYREHGVNALSLKANKLL